MPLRCKSVLTGIALFSMVALGSVSARAQTYTFTRIADSSTLFDPFGFTAPSLNNNGEVAFRGQSIGGESGIFRGSGGALTTIALDTTGFNFLGRFPSINDSGAVAFAATLSDGSEGIFRGAGGALTTIASTTGNPINFFAFFPSLNNSGAVAFQAERQDFTNVLYVGSGGALTTVSDPASPSNPFVGSFGGPSLNDNGQIAFGDQLKTGENGIFLSSGGTFKTIADDSGPLQGFDDRPSLNDNGQVAFLGSLDTGSQAIFLGDGNTLTIIADENGGFFSFDNPSLNNKGDVAFDAMLATFPVFGQGLFLNGHPILVPGDLLDGSIVTGVSFFREGLNDHGQLAFEAFLEDGRTGIYRADLVPEPSALLLFSVGLLGTLGGTALRRIRKNAKPD